MTSKANLRAFHSRDALQEHFVVRVSYQYSSSGLIVGLILGDSVLIRYCEFVIFLVRRTRSLEQRGSCRS